MESKGAGETREEESGRRTQEEGGRRIDSVRLLCWLVARVSCGASGWGSLFIRLVLQLTRYQIPTSLIPRRKGAIVCERFDCLLRSIYSAPPWVGILWTGVGTCDRSFPSVGTTHRDQRTPLGCDAPHTLRV